MKVIKPSAITSYIGKISLDCENKKKEICKRISACEIRSLGNKELLGMLVNEDIDVELVNLIEEKQCCDLTELVNEIKDKVKIDFEKIVIIAAALELGRRFYGSSDVHINSPEDIVPWIKHYALEKKEHFLCITLSGGHEIIKIHVVSIGTLNRSLAHPREIFAGAITDRCAAIILCHNHPSENPLPSNEDIELTKRLQKCSLLLGIKLLDHIIITKDDFYSFLANGLLENK